MCEIFAGPTSGHRFPSIAFSSLPRTLSLDASFNSHFRELEPFKSGSGTASVRSSSQRSSNNNNITTTNNNHNNNNLTHHASNGNSVKMECQQGYNLNMPQGQQGEFITYNFLIKHCRKKKLHVYQKLIWNSHIALHMRWSSLKNKKKIKGLYVPDQNYVKLIK